MIGTFERLLTLFLLILFFGVCTILYIKWMFYFYQRLETNHSPTEEGFWKKVVLLWRYNIIVSVLAAGVVLFYAPLLADFTIDLTIDTVVAAAILVAVANFTIRIASYAYFEEEIKSRSKDVLRKRRNSSHTAMFSLMLSIWVLLFMGAGIYVMNDQTSLLMNHEPFGSFTPAVAVGYALLIIVTPFVLGVISESVMWSQISPYTVPETLVDDFEKSEKTGDELQYSESDHPEADRITSEASEIDDSDQ